MWIVSVSLSHRNAVILEKSIHMSWIKMKDLNKIRLFNYTHVLKRENASIEKAWRHIFQDWRRFSASGQCKKLIQTTQQSLSRKTKCARIWNGHFKITFMCTDIYVCQTMLWFETTLRVTKVEETFVYNTRGLRRKDQNSSVERAQFKSIQLEKPRSKTQSRHKPCCVLAQKSSQRSSFRLQNFGLLHFQLPCCLISLTNWLTASENNPR